jgi:hypothetical protein
LSLCFNWAQRHEGVLGKWRYSSTHSLTSALDGGEWSASRPNRFTPRERVTGIHWTGGWVGSRAVLETVVKRKFPSPRWESNPRASIIQSVAQRYTDWAITAPVLRVLIFMFFVWIWGSIPFWTEPAAPITVKFCDLFLIWKEVKESKLRGYACRLITVVSQWEGSWHNVQPVAMSGFPYSS